MKLTLGIAACAALALGASALAEPAAKPLYKKDGELCSADEASGKIKYKAAGREWRFTCRSDIEWKMIRLAQADQEREQARYINQRSVGEGGAPLPPLRRSGMAVQRDTRSHN